jgi:hypothetical protein
MAYPSQRYEEYQGVYGLSTISKQKEETTYAISPSKSSTCLSLPGTEQIDPGPTGRNSHSEKENGPKPTCKIAVRLQG